MNLLLLPTELFEGILNHAIICRGIKRGLRLRLVNSVSPFDQASVNSTIDETQKPSREQFHEQYTGSDSWTICLTKAVARTPTRSCVHTSRIV